MAFENPLQHRALKCAESQDQLIGELTLIFVGRSSEENRLHGVCPGTGNRTGVHLLMQSERKLETTARMSASP